VSHRLKINVNSIGLQLSGKICLSIRHPQVIGFQVEYSKIPKAHSVPKKANELQEQDDAASTQTTSGLTAHPESSKPKSARRKSPAIRTRKAPAQRKKPSAKAGEKIEARPEPSSDEIRQRAYFISERRAQLSLPADASADWLEARRQLFAEAGIPVS
jgi:hypothetical protein